MKQDVSNLNSNQMQILYLNTTIRISLFSFCCYFVQFDGSNYKPEEVLIVFYPKVWQTISEI